MEATGQQKPSMSYIAKAQNLSNSIFTKMGFGKQEGKYEECNICYMEMQPGDVLSVLHCYGKHRKHKLHKECYQNFKQSGCS